MSHRIRSDDAAHASPATSAPDRDAAGALPGRMRGPLLWILVTLLLGQMAVAMLLSVAEDAPTFDEPAHIASGIAYVKTHDLRYDTDHPPLVQLLSSLPFRFARVNLPAGPSEIERLANGEDFPLTDPETLYGTRLLYEAGNDPGHVLWLSRLPIIALTLLFALVVFGFARDLFGGAGGLLALAVATLTPDLIAHGRLVDTDVAGAGFVVMACWFLWRASHRNPWWVIGAGLAFGAALASKYSALLMLPPVLGLAVFTGAAIPGDRLVRWMRGTAWGLSIVVVSFAVVWATYLAVDTHLRYQTRHVRADQATGPLATIADHLPVPEPYRVGVRFRIDDESHGRLAFLFGERYGDGRFYFFPALLAIKTPIGILAAWGIGIFAALARRRRTELAAYVLVPALFFLAVAMTSQFNIGVRHVIVVPFLLAVASGALVTRRFPARPLAAGVLIAAAALSVWRVFPSYLAYANEASGGPDRLYKLAADSNVDWGQDLRRLSIWKRDHHPNERFAILYEGVAPIAGYGFDGGNSWNLNIDHPQHVDGLVAISVSAYDFREELHTYLSSIGVDGEPIARIGHTILIYRGR